MKPLEIPESLLDLAHERGYRLDRGLVKRSEHEPTTIWLCWDFAVNEFVTSSLEWVTSEDALEYIEGSS